MSPNSNHQTHRRVSGACKKWNYGTAGWVPQPAWRRAEVQWGRLWIAVEKHPPPPPMFCASAHSKGLRGEVSASAENTGVMGTVLGQEKEAIFASADSTGVRGSRERRGEALGDTHAL